MASTPRRTSRRNSKAATPGDASVASRASTGSEKPGVPWHIQKAFAQDLEDKFPLAFCPPEGNSVLALLDSGEAHALSKFLDELCLEDEEKILIVRCARK